MSRKEIRTFNSFLSTVSDFNNTVQTVTFTASSGFETQAITLDFFDDALTESPTEFYILVVRLDNSSQNNAVDVSNIIFEPRNGFAVIGIVDNDGMSTLSVILQTIYGLQTWG